MQVKHMLHERWNENTTECGTRGKHSNICRHTCTLSVTLFSSVNFQNLVRPFPFIPVLTKLLYTLVHVACHLKFQLSIKQQSSSWVMITQFEKMSCRVLYLSSLRQGATAVRSSAAVHHPVASLEQTLAQRAPQIPCPKDAQPLLRGSCRAQRTQRQTLRLHLVWHAAPSVSWCGHSLTQTVRISPVVVKEQKHSLRFSVNAGQLYLNAAEYCVQILSRCNKIIVFKALLRASGKSDYLSLKSGSFLSRLTDLFSRDSVFVWAHPLPF